LNLFLKENIKRNDINLVDNKQMRILFSGFKDPYHSKYGGYDKITEINLPKKILLSEDYFLGKSNFKSHIMRIPFTLLDMATRIKRFKFDITHLFYGEITMLFFLPYLKNKKHKTVITVHLDIEQRRVPQLFVWILKFFDGVIVLSSEQKKYLKDKYNINSTFIPHGFSKPIFNEVEVYNVIGDKFDNTKINLLTIGNNYRDFETLDNIITNFRGHSKYHFHLVGIPNHIKLKYQNFENVSLYNRLSDDEYYSIISKSDYLFLPLSFATANNALLEAQYLNLPCILPLIPGVLDYAAPAPLNLFYTGVTDLKNKFLQLEKKPKTTELEYFARTNFDWSQIYKSLTTYYYSLVDNCQ